ncbi:unnamed protein product, partial [Callosobruchus maculatus]
MKNETGHSQNNELIHTCSNGFREYKITSIVVHISFLIRYLAEKNGGFS